MTYTKPEVIVLGSAVNLIQGGTPTNHEPTNKNAGSSSNADGELDD